MTSGTLRSILIVGAALAALSVAACNKPASTENTAAASDANATMAASNSMSSNSAMAANAASNDASATAPMAPASNSGQ